MRDRLIQRPIQLLVVFVILFLPIAIAEVPGYGSKVKSNDTDEGRELFGFLAPNAIPNFVIAQTNELWPEDAVYLSFCNGIICKNDIRLTRFGNHCPGSQVKPGDPDIGHVSKVINMLPRFYDVDGDGLYSLKDPVYLDDPTSPHVVSAGDIRLTGYLGYPAGTFVREGDSDNGLLIGPTNGWGTPMFYNANGEVDLSGMAIYGSGDKVYLDTTSPLFGSLFFAVTVNDVRIFDNCSPLG
jgi:hypothetical protein